MADTTIRTVDAGPKAVARQVDVAAPASAIYALVADPRRHGELDGSGTVRDAVSGPELLHQGDKFSVKMSMFGLPYRITSTVVEAEPDRVVAWRHPLGHVWRWDLAENQPGVTTVTETFSYDGATSTPVIKMLNFAGRNAEGITNTLARLKERFAS